MRPVPGAARPQPPPPPSRPCRAAGTPAARARRRPCGRPAGTRGPGRTARRRSREPAAALRSSCGDGALRSPGLEQRAAQRQVRRGHLGRERARLLRRGAAPRPRCPGAVSSIADLEQRRHVLRVRAQLAAELLEGRVRVVGREVGAERVVDVGPDGIARDQLLEGQPADRRAARRGPCDSRRARPGCTISPLLRRARSSASAAGAGSTGRRPRSPTACPCPSAAKPRRTSKARVGVAGAVQQERRARRAPPTAPRGSARPARARAGWSAAVAVVVPEAELAERQQAPRRCRPAAARPRPSGSASRASA